MSHLFEPDTGGSGHQEGDDCKRAACWFDTSILAYQFADVDADEKDGHTAPEDLDMAYGLMNGNDPLHNAAPTDHQDGEPAVNGMPLDELHV